MDGLRQYDGISGFPKREESEHDAYGTGHASTAISAALGMARARICRAGRGMSSPWWAMAPHRRHELRGHERRGLQRTRLIVILNDNQMSIAPNVGAVSATSPICAPARAG